jgi:DNA-binding LacI/PurR family transcriptional regulator
LREIDHTPQRIQIRDVAKRAGVSAATVSRVLNGRAEVRSAARERVLSAVVDLGYRPNRLARSLRRKASETVAMVVSDIENPHFAEAVRAAEDAVYQRGYRLLLCNSDESASKQQTYLETLAAECVSGVIVAPSDPADSAIKRLLDQSIHVVAFDRTVADPRADAVIGNNLDATRVATTHLIDGGHSAIGLVSGPLETTTGRDRLAGYEDVMRRAGLEPRVEFGGFRMDEGEQAALRLVDSSPRLSALVVANNLMAAGALKALRARGLEIPGDVALVTVDEPFWAEFVDPPLTTIAQPIRLMATSAVDLLFERIEGRRSESRRLTFDFELHIRASSQHG